MSMTSHGSEGESIKSMWNSVTENVNGKYEMKSFYDQKGLYPIRERCRDWIENALVNITSDATESVALQFYKALADYIKRSAKSEIDFSTMITPLRQLSPMELYTHFTNGFAHELVFIDEVTRSRQTNKLECIKNIIISCNEFYRILNNYLQPGTDQIINELYNPVSYITNIFQEYEIWRDSVFGELKHWQKKQIGICDMDLEEKKKVAEMEIEKLNKIQNCVDLLFEVTTKLLGMVEVLKNQSQFMAYKGLDQLARKILKEQENLMKDSFIVDNQPNQVIKTGTHFFCSVRWLLGQRFRSNYMNSTVKCVVVSDSENRLIELSTELQENEVYMDFEEPNRVAANFKSLLLKKIQRAGRRGSSDSVMDEKLALLFRMSSNNSIWALSVPVVVTVHGNQEHQALATILWDNAFSKVGRHLFTVPDRVSWPELAEALYAKCFAKTKRGFTDSNRQFLYKLLFPTNNRTMSLPEQEITWGQFCKDNLYRRTFSFWEWFHFAIKLIKDYLLTPWQNNLIEGFIGRNEAERKLSHAKPGTFLLRFSESVLGTIAISYNIGNNQVVHIQPCSMMDLKHKCLGDRIQECLDIIELFPYGIHKSNLITEFGQPSAPQVVNPGYSSPLTVTVIGVEPNNNTPPNCSDEDMME